MNALAPAPRSRRREEADGAGVIIEPPPRVGSYGRRVPAFLGLLLALLFGHPILGLAEPAPLLHAHAHNDYEHARPLHDALDQGFCSVEADIWLVDGQLLVAHDRNRIKPDRTLQSLYLNPLRERVNRNGGRIFPKGPEFSLLVDIKSEPKSTYAALRKVLENYQDVLTCYSNNTKQAGAISVILSGNHSVDLFAGETVRLASSDGVLSDLDGATSADLVPWISADWKKTFTWRGAGAIPDAEVERLQTIVRHAHAQHRRVRFWGAPDTANFWQAALAAGADLINTDDLTGLRNFFAASQSQETASPRRLTFSPADYDDRVQAIWTAQIIACLMGFQFEHKVASTRWVDQYPKKIEAAPVDDDWYYEMCALRAFEKYGLGLTVQQLGEQWRENNCGSWGSSEQARFNLARGITAPNCGHPRYNKLWFTIGPQFSADIYGALAPGMPNLAGKLARDYGHVNGYAEAVDGAVFMAGMISLGFTESDPKTIVRSSAKLIHPSSPYRQCLDLVVTLADAGKSPAQIAAAVEDRWHIEYPASNNAVPNGGLTAVGVWFGEGDFLKTVNVIYRAADFTDADCNAANAAAVVGAMRGMKGLPPHLVEPLHDRIVGAEMGKVKLTPPVDERISALAKRTAAIGMKLLAANGAKVADDAISINVQSPAAQPAELFTLADLMKYWNADWRLDRAGFGGAGGGIGNIRGITHLDGEVLATWPRDMVRGVVLRRTVTLSATPALTFQVAADAGRAWELEVYAGNKRLLHKLITGGEANEGERRWQAIEPDLKPFASKEIELRLYQRVLLADQIPGNAYWKDLRLR